jgi:hypothetical protein
MPLSAAAAVCGTLIVVAVIRESSGCESVSAFRTPDGHVSSQNQNFRNSHPLLICILSTGIKAVRNTHSDGCRHFDLNTNMTVPAPACMILRGNVFNFNFK